MSISQKWDDVTVTKGALAWTAVGASVLTMVVGFTWGGWVTGGTAETMAEDAAAQSHAQLAATICVDNFRNTETARTSFDELIELSGYRQRQFVTDSAWSTLPGGVELDRLAATECASMIAALDPADLVMPVAAVDDVPADAGTAVQ